MSRTMMLDLAALRALNDGQACVDVPCPLCGPSRTSRANQLRKVLRIWDDGEFVSYFCARCEEHGYASDRLPPLDTGRARPSEPRREAREPAASPAHAGTKTAIAGVLWGRARPLLGSPAETYLLSRGCAAALDGVSGLRYLPARGEHGHAMIARFGTDSLVTAVHLTRLAPDGSGKAGTEKDKIVLGDARGQPIVLFDNVDRGEVLIAEGIEDALSLAIATGWSSWAAGSAGRIPAAVECARRYSHIGIAIDDDAPIPVYNEAGFIIGQRPGAGRRARDRALEICPGAVPIELAKLVGRKIDANKLLTVYGPGALRACVAWAIIQGKFKSGEIGFHQMLREIAEAEAVLKSLRPIV